MNRIRLSEFDVSHLGSLTNAVEVCDESGAPLGVFVPAKNSRLPGEPEFDWAALQRELADDKSNRRSLDEIWATLEAK